MPLVEIHYHRPPARLDVFLQELVLDEPDYKITLHDPSTLTTPLRVGRKLIYEPGAPIVWYLFRDAWFDIGRFHLADGTFTGYYVNLIAPSLLEGGVWSLCDLCLDLWVDPDGTFQILDQDEFDEAVDRHWIDSATARNARSEMDRLIAQINSGRWPPDVVADYDLERVRALRETPPLR